MVWFLFHCALVQAEDGLFIPIQDHTVTESLEDGKLVTRFPIKRVNLVKATFRPDTEEAGRYWIELDFDRWHDPGDWYYFQLKGERIHGFYVRGDGGIEGGGRWALLFTETEKGREFLKGVAAAYQLPSNAVQDKTK